MTAEGNWLNPGRQLKQNGNTVQTDNRTGEQVREDCQFYSAWQVLGGGFTIQDTFHAFGAADSSGDFSSNHCNVVAQWTCGLKFSFAREVFRCDIESKTPPRAWLVLRLNGKLQIGTKLCGGELS